VGDTTPEIVLRALEPADAAQLLALRLRNREYFQPTEPLRDDDWFTLESQRREIAAEARSRASGTSLCFGVFAGGELVGRAALTSLADPSSDQELWAITIEDELLADPQRGGGVRG